MRASAPIHLQKSSVLCLSFSLSFSTNSIHSWLFESLESSRVDGCIEATLRFPSQNSVLVPRSLLSEIDVRHHEHKSTDSRLNLMKGLKIHSHCEQLGRRVALDQRGDSKPPVPSPCQKNGKKTQNSCFELGLELNDLIQIF